MSRYTRVIGHYNAETQAFSACAGTFTPGNNGQYMPDKDGTLVGVRLTEGQEAATSLTTDVQIRLSNALWSPGTVDMIINGGGIRTAPASVSQVVDYTLSLPVKSGSPITVEGRCATGACVTVSVIIIGFFEG